MISKSTEKLLAGALNIEGTSAQDRAELGFMAITLIILTYSV